MGDLERRLVTAGDIASGAVTSAKIASDAVTRTKIQAIKWGTVSVDPPSIAPNSSTNVDVAVAGLVTTDRILVSCMEDLENGLAQIAAYVPQAGTLRIRISNLTTGTIDGIARVWGWAKFVK